MSELICNKVARLHPATVPVNFTQFLRICFSTTSPGDCFYQFYNEHQPFRSYFSSVSKIITYEWTNRSSKSKINETLYVIWYHLDIKKTWKWQWRSVAFGKVADLSMQLYNTTLWVFFTLSKLYKWYQISQSSTYIPEQPSWTLLCDCLWYWLCILNYPSRI